MTKLNQVSAVDGTFQLSVYHHVHGSLLTFRWELRPLFSLVLLRSSNTTLNTLKRARHVPTKKAIRSASHRAGLTVLLLSLLILYPFSFLSNTSSRARFDRGTWLFKHCVHFMRPVALLASLRTFPITAADCGNNTRLAPGAGVNALSVRRLQPFTQGRPAYSVTKSCLPSSATKNGCASSYRISPFATNKLVV